MCGSKRAGPAMHCSLLSYGTGNLKGVKRLKPTARAVATARQLHTGKVG